jgi:putative radical SAM enzyme (TIGR03279 family)
MVRIAQVQPGSIADELELEIGSRIIRINGSRVRDNIDLTFLLADDELEVEVDSPEGETVIYEISKDPGDAMGIVPAPDTIRECANKCVFCFIDGNPQNVRPSLWMRDDDFRLSFTYGSYVTLTNLGPKGLQRLVDQRISPLYVSVHATEPQVRIDLLKNERAGLIMDHLRFFAENGLEVHTQVVLCPEWNDNGHLERTMEDLWSLGDAILSLSIVPVGLTKYNLNRPVRMLTVDEAAHAIDQVDRFRERAFRERGRGWVYVGDEMFLIAERGLPDDSYYDDGSLLENGVGTVRDFVNRMAEGAATAPDLSGRRVRIVTGASMAPFFAEAAPGISAATGAEIRVEHVVNDFYGEMVSTAGLLAGRDILAHLGTEHAEGDVILIPAEALNGDELFIDSLPLSELVEAVSPATVIPGFQLWDALHAALDPVGAGARGTGTMGERASGGMGGTWVVAT